MFFNEVNIFLENVKGLVIVIPLLIVLILLIFYSVYLIWFRQKLIVKKYQQIHTINKDQIIKENSNYRKKLSQSKNKSKKKTKKNKKKIKKNNKFSKNKNKNVTQIQESTSETKKIPKKRVSQSKAVKTYEEILGISNYQDDEFKIEENNQNKKIVKTVTLESQKNIHRSNTKNSNNFDSSKQLISNKSQNQKENFNDNQNYQKNYQKNYQNDFLDINEIYKNKSYEEENYKSDFVNSNEIYTNEFYEQENLNQNNKKTFFNSNDIYQNNNFESDNDYEYEFFENDSNYIYKNNDHKYEENNFNQNDKYSQSSNYNSNISKEELERLSELQKQINKEWESTRNFNNFSETQNDSENYMSESENINSEKMIYKELIDDFMDEDIGLEQRANTIYKFDLDNFEVDFEQYFPSEIINDDEDE